jgi:hypothetical protein
MESMTYMSDEKPPTHLDAIREAWHEFKEAVGFEAFCLSDSTYGPSLPAPIAWLCAPWKPLFYRFTPYNLERLFRPQKAERRAHVYRLQDFVFWCGGAAMTDEEWAEADALVAEFGIDFPPRDWEPMSAAEAVGATMGYSREEVAEIIAAPA